jgi:hypothetical protein
VEQVAPLELQERFAPHFYKQVAPLGLHSLLHAVLHRHLQMVMKIYLHLCHFSANHLHADLRRVLHETLHGHLHGVLHLQNYVHRRYFVLQRAIFVSF